MSLPNPNVNERRQKSVNEVGEDIEKAHSRGINKTMVSIWSGAEPNKAAPTAAPRWDERYGRVKLTEEDVSLDPCVQCACGFLGAADIGTEQEDMSQDG